MEEKTVGVLVFTALTLLNSIGCHYFIRSYFLASMFAAGLTTIIGQLAFRIHYGYWDPFLMISLVTMSLLALLLSLAIGLPFYLSRRWRRRPYKSNGPS
jgi:ABC-type proline/glycine betaine transport system permease subunit